MQTSTSSQIIDHIQKNQTASVRELSLALGLTRATITYHLRRLRQQSKIESIQPRKKGGRGRTAQRFQLAAGERANNYRMLCETLLGWIGEHAENGEDGLTAIGHMLAEQVKLAPGLPTQRLNRLCSHLNRRGYQASWIAGRQGPLIIFKNCPYHELVTKIPELCRMDRVMLCSILSGDFIQIEKLSFQSGWVGACRFSMNP